MTLDDDDDSRETRGKACEHVGACDSLRKVPTVRHIRRFPPKVVCDSFQDPGCRRLMYDWPLSSNTTVASPKVSIFFRIFDTN